jgi:hypothetical protein
MPTHKHTDLDDEKRRHVSDLAVLAESTYKRTHSARDQLVQEKTHGRYTMDEDYRSANHSVYIGEDGTVYFAIAGTNLKGKGRGRTLEDLGTDVVLATMGLAPFKLLPRYNQSKRELAKVMDKYKGHDIKLVGHSLGGQISRQLALEYDLESHSFAPGSSPISTFGQVKDAALSSDVRKRLAKNHSYFTIENPVQYDVLSTSDVLNPFSNNYVFDLKRQANGKVHREVKKSVLPHHSYYNYVVE